MHFQGFLHRDFKPDNMGIISEEQPIVLIFDVGLARIYTEGVEENGESGKVIFLKIKKLFTTLIVVWDLDFLIRF